MELSRCLQCVWMLCAVGGAVFVGLVFPASVAAQSSAPDRQVAITIDDLPATNSDRVPAATITEMTTKLLAALQLQKIPAVGFVNQKKVYNGARWTNESRLSRCGSTRVLISATILIVTCR